MSATVPRFSVLIPTYNGARYLAEAIDSVLHQTYPDFELLVLDNASTDETPELLARYRDPRLRTFRNERNLGFIGNVERGRTLARGHFLVDIGSDDVWEPGLLGAVAAFWERHPDLSFLHLPAVWIDAEGRSCGRIDARWREVTPGTEAFVEVFERGFCFSGMFMRRSLLEEIGPLDRYWDDMLDLWWFLQLSLRGDVGYLDEPLVRFRLHDATLSASLLVKGQGFRHHVAVASSAFDWPAARAAGLTPADRQRALRAIVLESIAQLHAVRDRGTRRDVFEALRVLLQIEPAAALRPATAARVGLAMLPRAALHALRRWSWRRRGRGIVLQALPASDPLRRTD